MIFPKRNEVRLVQLAFFSLEITSCPSLTSPQFCLRQLLVGNISFYQYIISQLVTDSLIYTRLKFSDEYPCQLVQSYLQHNRVNTQSSKKSALKMLQILLNWPQNVLQSPGLSPKVENFLFSLSLIHNFLN